MSLWQPRSTCESSCVEPDHHRVSRALMWKRVVVTAAVLLLAALATPLLALLPRHLLVHVQRLIARAVLAGLGVRHRAAGRLPRQRALLVANHVSWLDVVVILAHAPARLLAKHEVRSWPLIGRLATTIGTVFVDRTRPRALPATVAEVRANLAAGGVVAVFPEGTTWCGRTAGVFRPAMFQAAVDAHVPVVPVRLTFEVAGAPSTIAAFVGDETLLRSIGRVVAARGLTVDMKAFPALYPEPSAARRSLARAAASFACVSGAEHHPVAALRPLPATAPIPLAAPVAA